MKLQDVCSIKHGFAFKGKYITHEASGYELVTPGNFSLAGGFQHAKKPKYYTGPIPEEYVLEPDDLIVTMTDLSRNADTLGLSALIPNDGNKYLHNQRIGLLTCDQKQISKHYLHWLLRTREYQRTIAGMASGSTVKHTSPSSILSYEATIPDLQTQKRIAVLLDLFDAKIEANTKLNGYLEELFDSCFKQSLNMVDETWDTVSLLDIADYKNGLAMQKFRPNIGDKGLPVLKIRELGQESCGNDAERCRSDIDESVTVHDGDLVFSWSGTLLLRFWAGGDAGLNQHLFKVTSGVYPSWFYYAWTKHHLARFAMLAKDRATTMGHIKRSALEESEVLLPPKEKLAMQTKCMQPIIDQVIANKIEIRKLAALRDALLPKLMSGEIDVSKIDLTQLNSHLV